MRLRTILSIYIYDSLKENWILHIRLVFFYSEDELLIRKIFICERCIRLHQWNFPYFSVCCAIKTQILHLNLWQFERELNSASATCLLLPWGRIFDKKNFNSVKPKFVWMNEIFQPFQFLLPFTRKFSISICDPSKENSILHLYLFFFHFRDEFSIRKIFIS